MLRLKSLLSFVLLLCLPVSAMAAVKVVTTFSVLADLTRQIGGGRVNVISLIGPNQDTHVFQPAPSTVKLLGNAQVYVSNGLGLEGWLSRLERTSGFRGITIVASQGIKPLTETEHADDDDHQHEHGGMDPHAWNDPQQVEIYVRNITAGLIKADPAGRAYYQARSQVLRKRVQSLDAWAAAQFASIPDAKRKVVTSHDAFAYLGARYHIHFMAPQGISTDSEASAKSVASLIKQIRAEKVKAVFFENMSNQQLLKQIAQEAGVKVDGKLYADALSEPGGPADTWEKMFQHNVSTIMSALR